MNEKQERRYSWIVLVGMALFFLFFLLPAALRLPGCDSGIFLYCGSRAAAGDVAYIDYWDHKGPMIFYINALASILTPRSVIGSAILQFAFLFGAFVFCWKMLKKAFGFAPALAGTLCILPLLEVAELKYNFTEIYALLFQFGTLYFFYVSEQVDEKRHALMSRLAIGLFMGFAFMLRPNLVGVGGAIALAWVINGLISKDFKGLWSRAWQSALGYIFVWVIFSIYFVWNSAFWEFLDGMIWFNYNATESSFSSWLKGVGHGIYLMLPISVFGVVAWGGVLFKNRKKQLTEIPSEPLVLVAVLYLPIEMVVSSVSGRMYAHYYLAWLPVFALLIAMGLNYLFKNSKFQQSKISVFNGRVGFYLLIVMLIALPQSWSITGNTIKHVKAGSPRPGRLIDFVEKNSVPEDNVLICSYFAGGIYYMLDRKAPSKYVVQFNFWFGSDEHWTRMNREFLADIKKARPKYIIWMKNNNEIRPQVELVVKNAGIKYSYSSTVLPGAFVFIRQDAIKTQQKRQ